MKILSKISSVHFSCSVVSDSLWPHGLQHARLSCPSPTTGACLNSCPLSQWCHPIISSSVILLSSCLQSFSAPGSFLMSQLFASGGQSIGASVSTSVFPMNLQSWFPLGLTGLISLRYKGLSRLFSSTTYGSVNSLALNHFYGPTVISYMTTGKAIALTIGTISKVVSLLFNMLFRFVIAFLPRW